MIAIYKRELKNFFTTVTGWLFIAAHVCMAGLYFFAVNLLSGYANVGETVSSILFLLLLTTPILSMRILAEERKQKTDQLTLTSPVSVAGIVCGKYLALATVFTVPVAVMCTFPIILSRYGTVPMGESYTAILVYYLFGLTDLSCGGTVYFFYYGKSGDRSGTELCRAVYRVYDVFHNIRYFCIRKCPVLRWDCLFLLLRKVR